MSRTSQSLYDRHITVFSPEGRLYQVEYAFKAVKGCNITAIAVRGETAACIAVQKKIPLAQAQQDKLLVMSSVTSLHKVTDHIGCGMVGLPGDCRMMLFRSRDTAAEQEFLLGYPVPVLYLTQKIANIIQVYSQHAYMRLLACCGIFIGIDDETNQPVIYRFDPAGWFAGYKACAIGTKEQEASIALEKVVKQKELKTEEQLIQETLICFQSVLGVDTKASDIEIGLVTIDNPEFRVLGEEEIDKYLTVVAERD